jgi:fermentation-respiration switch protein FrsA (DUF1100 family)
MNNGWKTVIFLGCILLLVGVGVVASYLQAEVFIHNPPERRSAEAQTPADYQMTYESLELKTQDGIRLAAWYIPSHNRAAVILIHGYKSDRTSMLGRAQMLTRHGYGILLVDLRAHGKSDGDLVTFGLKEVQDVDAAYRYLLTRSDVDADKIGALGCSMGGTVVLLSAAQNPAIKAVVSESTFAELSDSIPSAVADTGLPPILFAPFVEWFAERSGGFDAAQVSAIAHIRAISPRPVFLMQGGNDLVVIPESGKRLYEAAGEPRQLWFDDNVGHASFADELPAEYERRVVAFFDQYLLSK